MPRVARSKLQTSYFHVIVQGINKEYIFNTEMHKKKYEKLMKTYIEKFNIKLVAYCIMSNHAHMLIYAKDSDEMANYMKGVNTSFAMYYNKQKNRVGIVFRNRYDSEPICNQKYLMNCIAYIHNNPVKAKITRMAGLYKYSSYNDYIRGTIEDEILELVFGCKTGYIDIFKAIHKNSNDADFKDYVESDYNKLIEKVTNAYGPKVYINETMFDQMIKRLIVNEKIPIKAISEKFNISRYKISKILKT